MADDYIIKNIRLKKEVFERVRELAKLENRSISNMVETILIRTLNEINPQNPIKE